MKILDLGKFYLGYISFLASLASLAITIDRDYFLANSNGYLAVSTVLILIPLIAFGASNLQGPIGKESRLVIFSFLSILRVDVVATIGLVVLLIFTALFLRNIIVYGFYQGEQIFLNVLLLNVFFVGLLMLVLAGRIRTKQPPALLVQNEGHPEIYLYRDGLLRHIPDPETLLLTGYSFDDVVVISEKEFSAYKRGPTIESVKTAKLLECGTGHTWMILDNVSRRIPDPYTLNAIRQINNQPIQHVSQSQFGQYPEGKPLASVLRVR